MPWMAVADMAYSDVIPDPEYLYSDLVNYIRDQQDTLQIGNP